MSNALIFRSKFLPLFLIAPFLLMGCPVQNQSESLLSSQFECGDTNCPEIQKSIQGSVSIQADAGEYQMNIEKSDLIEISGKCKDLGIRQNRILVQVYEGEDTSTAPYIDNDLGSNCTGSLTPAINNKKCFFITQGIGVNDGGNEYPQCFNGRFSFSVRLGKILRENETGPVNNTKNPLRKYLVRFKIRTNDGVVQESNWSQTLVNRSIAKPGQTIKYVPDKKRLEIFMAAFKNLGTVLPINVTESYYPQVSYWGMVTRNFKTGGDDTPALITNFINGSGNYPLKSKFLSFPYPNDDDTLYTGLHINRFFMTDIIPGVDYKLKFLAEDLKYVYARSASETCSSGYPCVSNFTENSGYGTEVIYKIPALTGFAGGDNSTLSSCSGSEQTSKKVCTATVANPPSYPNANAIEWAVIKNVSAWSENFDPATAGSRIGTVNGDLCTGSGGTLTTGCSVTHTISTPSTPQVIFRAYAYPGNTACAMSGSTVNIDWGGTYSIAYRYISGTFKGAWSTPSTNCTLSN